jgi:hypothetical protein
MRGAKAAFAKLNSSNGTTAHTSPNGEQDSNSDSDSNATINSIGRGKIELDKGSPPIVGAPEDLSPAERAAYEALTVERQRQAFLIIRRWAARAAENGEPDFGIAQSFLAKELRCDRTNVSDIIRKFRELGIIEQTKECTYRQSPARYRWTLETTIPVPAMPEGGRPRIGDSGTRSAGE